MARIQSMSMLLVVAVSMMAASCSGKVESEFMAGCTSQGAPESRCTCLYEKLEDKYGEDGLEAMQKGERMLPGFVEATAVGAAECSGVDPSTALKQLGLKDESPDAAREPVVQGGGFTVAGQAEVATSVQGTHASDDAVIENAIAITASSETGDEYKEARKVAAGDLDADGASDAAALFTVEVASQNTSAQYLSAFLRQQDGSLKFASVTPVSGGDSSISEIAVEEGAIRLKTLTLGPDDPECCPSVVGQVEYLLHGGKLKRVN